MTTSMGSPGADVLPVEQCWQLLHDAVVGRLAVIVEGKPDLFPVNHVVDHETVVFRSGTGTKTFGALREAVAFEVDGYDPDGTSAWSVVVHGVAHEVARDEEIGAAQAMPLFRWPRGLRPHLVRIEPTIVGGRRIHVTGGKGPRPASTLCPGCPASRM
ncbi:pyridoxamine 5'-phosphate oxidase family protein [Lapillicoccus sp.]|uniref:pyridoxamine 5'-phosphate oxidase family protein n=1 Tax=Lapillicoccus sp. TaxID=1909287 RepID=UPI0025F2AEF7|nr:pyridoxamine 5'-phosphate oxidase family protein [Lapillicoccus sp.]